MTQRWRWRQGHTPSACRRTWQGMGWTGVHAVAPSGIGERRGRLVTHPPHVLLPCLCVHWRQSGPTSGPTGRGPLPTRKGRGNDGREYGHVLFFPFCAPRRGESCLDSNNHFLLAPPAPWTPRWSRHFEWSSRPSPLLSMWGRPSWSFRASLTSPRPRHGATPRARARMAPGARAALSWVSCNVSVTHLQKIPDEQGDRLWRVRSDEQERLVRWSWSEQEAAGSSAARSARACAGEAVACVGTAIGACWTAQASQRSHPFNGPRRHASTQELGQPDSH